MQTRDPNTPNRPRKRTDKTSRFLEIYQLDAVRRAISELEPPASEDHLDRTSGDRPGPRRDPAELSAEERNRLHHLKRIATHPLGPRRRLVLGSPQTIQRVAALKQEAPHFANVLDLVSRALCLSMVSGTPLRLPPILLLGEAGIGKTFVLRRLAEALGAPFEVLAMNMTDSFTLRGLNIAWRGARAGRIARALIDSVVANPILLLDEFDKMPALSAADRPYEPFHSLFEEENAVAFVDDFLEFPLRVDHVIWIASANALVPIPDAILDRLLILEIAKPSPEKLQPIIDAIYASVRKRYADWLEDRPASDVRLILQHESPRRLKRILGLAAGFAATGGRPGIALRDAERAIDLVSDRPGTGAIRPIGFVKA